MELLSSVLLVDGWAPLRWVRWPTWTANSAEVELWAAVYGTAGDVVLLELSDVVLLGSLLL